MIFTFTLLYFKIKKGGNKVFRCKNPKSHILDSLRAWLFIFVGRATESECFVSMTLRLRRWLSECENRKRRASNEDRLSPPKFVHYDEGARSIRAHTESQADKA